MIPNSQSTICALITPAGKGAVAVIRVSGNEALDVAEKLFFLKNKKRISQAPSHSIHFGLIKNGGKIIDEVLLSVFRTPHSYTGEDVIEISCHGSIFIQQQILNLLNANGVRMAQPGEFTLRAFLNGKLDLSQAESVADIIASENESAHQLAFSQMRGGYSDMIKKLRDELIRFAAMLELELDFSEEDVEFANRIELTKLVLDLIFKIEKLLESFSLGNVLKNGIPVVIAGKPNTGKSTLLNVMLNDERAIVSPIAGTTRDTIEDEMIIEGIRFRFIDTAGIRETEDLIETKGVERTLEKIKKASVVIYLFDPKETSADELNKILGEFNSQAYQQANLNQKFKLIPVANKIDQYVEDEVIKDFLSVQNLVCISAKKMTNIEFLKKTLLEFVPSNKINSGEHVVSNARHAASIYQAKLSLQKVFDGIKKNISTEFLAADLRFAITHLGEITGEVTNENLLEFIFSKFCIGK